MNKTFFFAIPIAIFIAAVIVYYAMQPNTSPNGEKVKLDVRFITTPMNVVDQMLLMAEIKEDDVLYDLGCGDGRIAIQAAKRYGIQCVGFDIDPERIKESRENAIKEGVDDLVQFEAADIFDLDFSKANVIMMYLLPELNVRLIPQLQQMKLGSRIVSHNFNMEGVEPDVNKVIQHIRNPDDPYEIYAENDELDFSVIYLWSTPLKMSGSM